MYDALTRIVKEALETESKGFVKLVEEATELLRNKDGRVGSLCVNGRLVRLKPHGQALIIGDLHGDLESLIDIMKKSNCIKRMKQNRDMFTVFLGDYGDRGAYSAEVYYTVLKLNLLFSEQVVLMRGNHEGPADLVASPHDMPEQYQARFGEKGAEVYAETCTLFEFLYNAMLVEGQYLLIHGGIPAKANRLEDLAFAHVTHPKRRFLEDMLWSDPDETAEGTHASPRGAGKLFGKNITIGALRKFGAKIMIRGHESCNDGYKTDHDGRILTLFSRKGPPYFNDHGAYLDVSLSKRFENVEQLVPFIHKF